MDAPDTNPKWEYTQVSVNWQNMPSLNAESLVAMVRDNENLFADNAAGHPLLSAYLTKLGAEGCETVMLIEGRSSRAILLRRRLMGQGGS